MKFNEQYCSFTHGGGEANILLAVDKDLVLGQNVLLSPQPCVKLQYCSKNFMLIISHVSVTHHPPMNCMVVFTVNKKYQIIVKVFSYIYFMTHSHVHQLVEYYKAK